MRIQINTHELKQILDKHYGGHEGMNYQISYNEPYEVYKQRNGLTSEKIAEFKSLIELEEKYPPLETIILNL